MQEPSKQSDSGRITLSYALIGPFVGTIAATLFLVVATIILHPNNLTEFNLESFKGIAIIAVIGLVFFAYPLGLIPALLTGLYAEGCFEKNQPLSPFPYYSIGVISINLIMVALHLWEKGTFSGLADTLMSFAVMTFGSVSTAWIMLLHTKKKVAGRRMRDVTQTESTPP